MGLGFGVVRTIAEVVVINIVSRHAVLHKKLVRTLGNFTLGERGVRVTSERAEGSGCADAGSRRAQANLVLGIADEFNLRHPDYSAGCSERATSVLEVI